MSGYVPYTDISTIEHVCPIKLILHVGDLSFISGGGGELGGGTGEKPVQDCVSTFKYGTPFIFSGSLKVCRTISVEPEMRAKIHTRTTESERIHVKRKLFFCF